MKSLNIGILIFILLTCFVLTSYSDVNVGIPKRDINKEDTIKIKSINVVDNKINLVLNYTNLTTSSILLIKLRYTIYTKHNIINKEYKEYKFDNPVYPNETIQIKDSITNWEAGDEKCKLDIKVEYVKKIKHITKKVKSKLG